MESPVGFLNRIQVFSTFEKNFQFTDDIHEALYESAVSSMFEKNVKEIVAFE